MSKASGCSQFCPSPRLRPGGVFTDRLTRLNKAIPAIAPARRFLGNLLFMTDLFSYAGLPKHRRNNAAANRRQQIVKHLERPALVLDQWIALAKCLQPDALLQILDPGQVTNPQLADVIQQG